MRRCAASTFSTSRSVPLRVNSDWTEAAARVAWRFYRIRERRGKRAPAGLAIRKGRSDHCRDRCVSKPRKAFLEAYPAGRWHESGDALLSDKTLDFVDICTPPSSHPGLIERALDVRL